MKISDVINTRVYCTEISVVFSQISEAVHTQEPIPLGVILQIIK
jgi:hypothetical protein